MEQWVYIEVGDGQHVKCVCAAELSLHEGDQCIIESDRLLDFGRVIGFDDAAGVVPKEAGVSKVLRRATLQDQAKANENVLMNRMALKTCVAKSEKFNLGMRLVRVRYTFDRTVLMVLFTADDRLDFREMVKELAGELRSRVEMKQIGVRDEAGIIGGTGTCGRSLCCCSWLRHFESINVKMAKAQRLSLNPSAMSGMCGRLKCCLRYEYDCYKEMNKHLPRDGESVKCPDGVGVVVDKNVLEQKVRVRLEDRRVLEYGVDQVQAIGGRRTEPSAAHEDDVPEEVRKLEAGGS